MSDRANETTATPAFELDHRVSLSIDHDLAINLGRLILDSNTKNTALLALGHQLRNLSKEDLQPIRQTLDL